MTTHSRLPPMPDAPREIVQFLDAIDRRQLTVSQIPDLDPGASSAEIVATVNLILAAHRTK